MTVLDLITAALQEIGAYAQGETVGANDAAFALQKLNRMIDGWNAQRLFVYNINFATYTLVPGLNPHTIGPSGATYTVVQRPVRIEAANIVLNNVTPSVKTPLNLRDDQWYAKLPVPSITTTIPTDLYYSPAWPNGQLYLWPVPATNYLLELWTWVIISQYASYVTIVSLPPGYFDALAYSLAENLAPSFGKQPGLLLVELARKSREVIKSPNSMSPSICTVDYGMPNENYKNLPSYNWRSGGSGY